MAFTGEFLNMRQAEKIRAEPPPLPSGPFRVIVADVPWPYEVDAKDPSGRGVHPYSTMSLADICALPVRDLAADDAILWLWTTNHHILEARRRAHPPGALSTRRS